MKIKGTTSKGLHFDKCCQRHDSIQHLEDYDHHLGVIILDNTNARESVSCDSDYSCLASGKPPQMRVTLRETALTSQRTFFNVERNRNALQSIKDTEVVAHEDNNNESTSESEYEQQKTIKVPQKRIISMCQDTSRDMENLEQLPVTRKCRSLPLISHHTTAWACLENLTHRVTYSHISDPDVMERKKRLNGNRSFEQHRNELVSNRAAVHIADVVADKEAHCRQVGPPPTS
ncbi:hypothetical protein G5I_14417 [Acromyrmex echinatior]|uniref:Uncharacterized protein n=1 Tax=Acromyrmex echinatior TaxID=103372 RepID=F4X7N3_ACREC|nr:hypothetical protein G5I_14417 [Acromyrmex echinatior]